MTTDQNAGGADRPLCRYCGKPIRKRTTTVTFVLTQEEADRRNATAPRWWSYVVGRPATKADAQRLVNQEIVSVKRGYVTVDAGGRHTSDVDFIQSVSVWDGESYEDPFFCNGAHAKDFGYAMARRPEGWGTQRYHDALANRGKPTK